MGNIKDRVMTFGVDGISHNDNKHYSDAVYSTLARDIDI